MSRRKIDKLIFEVADILPQRAAELREQATGRPRDEEEEIMSAATAMDRLYGRLTERARRRWVREKESLQISL
jgi:hypothetical protein